jgi:hypothetical protein
LFHSIFTGEAPRPECTRWFARCRFLIAAGRDLPKSSPPASPA